MSDLGIYNNNNPAYDFFTTEGHCFSSIGSGDECLVFIHGVGMNQHVWQPQIAHFSKQYRVIVYDIFGHGHSPLPTSSVTIKDYVNQLKQILDHLGLDHCAIVGHSMGALISVAFALEHPEMARCLIPMNIVYKRTQQQRESVLQRAQSVLNDNKVNGIDTTLQRWFNHPKDPAKLSKKYQIKRWLETVNPIGYGLTYQLFAQSDELFIGQLKRLTMPVLYLTGEDDPNSTPAMSLAMESETPGAKSIIVKNNAHMMAYINPEQINPILADFLNTSFRAK